MIIKIECHNKGDSDGIKKFFNGKSYQKSKNGALSRSLIKSIKKHFIKNLKIDALSCLKKHFIKKIFHQEAKNALL